MTTDTTTFGDTVPFHHRHIALENRDDVYIVGDVHGCLDSLETLLSTLDLGSNDLAVFVGDLVRKGPESKAVLDRVRRSPRLVSVCGNNERRSIDGEASLPTLDAVDLRYLESLPAAISWDVGGVHHPYHSFDGTVQRFLETAVNDPDVLAIEAAIFRTASGSQVIESLLEAAVQAVRTEAFAPVLTAQYHN
ncbi:metallophosphoesterase [Natrinema caseinilyticum]|uniref:metallophosphoesterase n=1 Tax=Natrinema caseinilyticum TaxID=2961570 RepID=UPI0020C53AD2|nr:metallophosphoesterase [Natrinema caseinilyticum]